MSNIMEQVADLQSAVVPMRTLYSKTISECEKQNNKIELRLLKKTELKDYTRMDITLAKIPPEENLLNCLPGLMDKDDKEKASVIANKLKDLDNIMTYIANRKTCVICPFIDK